MVTLEILSLICVYYERCSSLVTSKGSHIVKYLIKSEPSLSPLYVFQSIVRCNHFRKCSQSAPHSSRAVKEAFEVYLSTCYV